MMLKEVERLWHKLLGRATKVEALARPSIEFPRDGIQFCLRETGEVGVLWEILAQQTVGVLVDTALPRTMRIGEINRDTRVLSQPSMLSHLAPLVVSHGEALLRINPIQDRPKGRHRRLGGGIVHLDQRHEKRGPFDQGTDRRSIASPFDEIALPVARNYPLIDHLAEGHLAALNALQDRRGILTVNLGTGHGVSVLEMIAALEKASGRKVPYKIAPRRAGDIAACYADVAYAQAVLGWRARRGVAEMCADAWRWEVARLK